ncbi:fumarylacetoacetate hydrolase family protein [Bacillus marinisedimentorum]|uniref:fumarylacetoacetate hydrolase family protein n=1 Tax=Bacillus marinisedimentorum TaxID=1821260 RepID=UPI000871F338|nr:fumarylacetoacetate hydrolase family protein [Bacillus marinisedimentorum]
MKFITGQTESLPFVGVLTDGDRTVVDLHKAEQVMDRKEIVPSTMLEAINMGSMFIKRAEEILSWIETQQDHPYSFDVEEVKLLAPIPRPAKNIFCIGKNYRDHAIELGSEKDVPEAPIIFSKSPTAVVGHQAPVHLHKHVTAQLDYEGELAVIIGKKGRAITEEDAFQHIFGYTILNDVTARDLQQKHKQYLLGKSLDTSCPIGPWIVHRSQIPEPAKLKIETRINGEVRQQGSLNELLFTIPYLISIISRGMTLEPGDIIATGTPAGVGKGMKPPRFLKAGDLMEITIPEIGTLSNMVTDEGQ